MSDLKIVIAPTSHAAVAIRTALARSGTPLINIEAVTPTGLARHVWKAVRPEDGAKYISRSAAEYVLGSLAGQRSSAEFDLLRNSVSTVFESIQLDKLRGRSFKELSERAHTPTQESYAALFLQYNDYLTSAEKLDDGDIRILSQSLVDQFVDQRHVGLVALCDMVDLTESEASLIATLGEQSFIRCLIGSGHRKSSRLPNWKYPQDSTLKDDPSTQAAQNAQEESTIQLIQAGTRREEVRSVLADIVGGNVSFDQIELAYTDAGAYESEIVSACERFGIPWQSSSPHLPVEHRLGGLLRSYSDWIYSGYETRVLVDMLRSQLLDVRHLEVIPGDIASAFEAFPISLKRMCDPAVWQVIAEKASGRNVRSAQLNALKQFVNQFIDFVVPRKLSFFDYKNQFIRLTEAFAGDYTELRQVTDFLASHFSFGAKLDQLESDATWIAKRVIQSIPGSKSSHSLGIWVLPIRDAGYGSARKIYVLGLDDQASSDSGESIDNEYSLIPDVNFKPNFIANDIVSIRLVAKELYRRYSSDLVLSIPGYDLSSGRTLFPSSSLIELTATTKLNPKRRSAWLDIADSMAGRKEYSAFEVYPSLGFGRDADLNRLSDTWTEFDGVLNVPPDWRIKSTSPSKLETLSACPYRFFLSNVLSVNVRESPTDAWITSREEGTLVHQLFEKHTRGRIEEQIGLEEGQKEILFNLLEDELTRFARLMEGNADALVARKLKELQASIALYFRHEQENEGSYLPVAVEYSFSNYPDSDTKPCTVSVSTGSVSLSGRLDRLDLTSSGNYVITDYKTGSFKGFTSKELRQLTEHLQWAFYAFMVESSTGIPVEKFEYFFPSKRGAGLKREVAAPSREEVLGIIEDLSGRYGSGYFIQAAGQDVCKYCEFKTICGDLTQRKDEITSKFLSPGDSLTPAFSNWKLREKIKGDD